MPRMWKYLLKKELWKIGSMIMMQFHAFFAVFPRKMLSTSTISTCHNLIFDPSILIIIIILFTEKDKKTNDEKQVK